MKRTRMNRVSKKKAASRKTEEYARYRLMLEETDKPWCWGCGRKYSNDRFLPLVRAHLSAGAGRQIRKEDRRAVVILCNDCHWRHRHEMPAAHGDFITDAEVLWLKRERDPEFWDWEFIKSIWLANNPPEPVEPVWLREVYQRNQQHI